MTLINEFLTDTVTSSTIPYVQVISPPNLKIPQLQKGDFDMGIFIKKEQAELAGFTPDETWKPCEVPLGNDMEVGFITTNPKFVIIHKSQVEVYNKNESGRWQYLGLGYENGVETSFRQDAKAAPKEYRQVVRHLLLFLGKDDQPLHEVPIQWKAKGGLNGALYKETGMLYNQVSKVYFNDARKAGQKISGTKLSPFALAFVKVDISLTWCRLPDPEKAPFCVPSSIKMPTIDNVGKSMEVEREDRKIIFHGVALEDVMLSKNSPAGKVITTWHQEYQDFPKPRRNLATFEDVGTFSDYQYLPNGQINVHFAGKLVTVPRALEYVVHTDGMYKASGVIDNNQIIIKSIEPFDDGFSGRGKPNWQEESDDEYPDDDFN